MPLPAGATRGCPVRPSACTHCTYVIPRWPEPGRQRRLAPASTGGVCHCYWHCEAADQAIDQRLAAALLLRQPSRPHSRNVLRTALPRLASATLPNPD